MNHHDIHEIIEQISQTLDCPQCKNKILPNNIIITNIAGADCTFDVQCNRCSTEMTLSAHVEKTMANEAKFHNRSSQILHDGFVEAPVSAQEVEQMKFELANFCGSFVETFSR